MSVKKLLIIGSLPPPYSGYETATEVLLAANLDDYCNVEFFDYSTADSPDARGRFSLVNIWNTVKVLLKLVWVLFNFKPNIVNLPLSQNRTGFLKWILLAIPCRITGAKIISRFGGDSMDKFYMSNGFFFRKLVSFGLSIVDVVIVRSPSLVEQFEKIPQCSEVVVVPNGFDLKKWRHGFTKKSGDCLSIAFLGTVSYAKGAYEFIYSIKNLIDLGIDDINVSIIGPIIKKERNIMHLSNNQKYKLVDICTLIDDLELSDVVEMHPPVSWKEKKKLFQSIDILVAPSHSEGGVPYVILEAMASECAVISTPVKPVADYLTDDKNILLVPFDSPNSISEKIIKLKNNPKLLKLIRVSGLHYVEKNHSLAVFKKRMKRVFNI